MPPKRIKDSGSTLNTLDNYFTVKKSSGQPGKKSAVSVAKKPPKTRTFKKKTSPKKKTVDLDSEDDNCESYDSAKSQKESRPRSNEKVVTVNRPTPLKTSSKNTLKAEQVRQKLIGFTEVSFVQKDNKIMDDGVIEDNVNEVKQPRRSLDDADDEKSKESPKKIKTEDGAKVVNISEVKREPLENVSRVTKKLFSNIENIFEPDVKIEVNENKEIKPACPQLKTEPEVDAQTAVKSESTSSDPDCAKKVEISAVPQIDTPKTPKREIDDEVEIITPTVNVVDLTSEDSGTDDKDEVDLDATIVNFEDYGIVKEELSDYCLEHDESLKMKMHIDAFVDFNEIINYVIDQPNLISVLFEEEQRFLKQFMDLHEKYKFFCFRLFTRQLVWYDVEAFRDKIHLDMDDKLFNNMLRTLQEMKIIHTDYSKEDPVDLLNQLNAKQVKEIHKSFKLKTKCQNKEDHIKSILKHCSSQSTLTFAKSSDDLLMDRIKEKFSERAKLDLHFYNMLSCVHLLYSFMIPDFVRPVDIYRFRGEVRKKTCILPSFSTDFTKIFTRETFLRYFLAVEQFNEFMIAKESSNEIKMLKIAKLAFEDFQNIIKEGWNDEKNTILNFHKRFTAGRVLAKILSMACKQFTRYSDLVMKWLEVLARQDQYALKMRGDWYNHIAMIHEKRKDFESAIDILYEALVDPDVSEISKYDLSHRAKRLLSKCDDKDMKATLSDLILPSPEEITFPNIIISGKEANVPGAMRVHFKLDGDTVNVEEYALNHYRQLGFPKGVHAEGRLMTVMYILLFWDIIFDKYVPGTFISEIQYFPLDFFSYDFYINRKTEIDSRLEQIEGGWTQRELEGQLMDNCINYGQVHTVYEIMKGSHTEIIMDAIKCVPRKVLRMIFERFVRNYRDYRAGMPDLFVCNPNTRKCKFVEVKSENDKLSMKQMVWLDYLRSIGADIELCHVYPEGKKIKPKLLKKNNRGDF